MEPLFGGGQGAVSGLVPHEHRGTFATLGSAEASSLGEAPPKGIPGEQGRASIYTYIGPG